MWQIHDELGVIMISVTFNNISAISWRSVFLVEETTDLAQVTDKLYHIMLYTSPWSGFELTTSVMIGTDCIGKSKYHTITAMTAPLCLLDFRTCAKIMIFTFAPRKRICIIGAGPGGMSALYHWKLLVGDTVDIKMLWKTIYMGRNVELLLENR